MKRLILAAFALTTAASVFAQGTVAFYNRNTAGTSHIYAPLTGNLSLSQVGNGTADIPAGTTSWAGFNGIGLNGLTGPYGGSTTLAQLLAANGANQPESSLVPSGQTTTFRTGTAAQGFIALITDSLGNVPNDSAAATLEVVAWDNSSGNYPTWTQASVAWAAGLIAAGKGGAFTVNNIGGSVNTPPNMSGQSFNLYIQSIPEPSTFALAGLGAAALLIFRRRK